MNQLFTATSDACICKWYVNDWFRRQSLFFKNFERAVVCPAFRERTFGGIVPTAQGGVRRYNIFLDYASVFVIFCWLSAILCVFSDFGSLLPANEATTIGDLWDFYGLSVAFRFLVCSQTTRLPLDYYLDFHGLLLSRRFYNNDAKSSEGSFFLLTIEDLERKIYNTREV